VPEHRVLLGVTGSIGAYKACLLLRRMKERGIDVKVAMTEAATRMVGTPSFHALSGHPVITDMWDLERTSQGEIHIELTDWADALVVYPATADLMAAMATGRATDALELAALAAGGPVVLVPAMHHRMLANPATRANMELLRSRGVVVVEPEVGPLASGEVGPGRLPEPATALEHVLAALAKDDLAGRHVLVTAGPTREHLDPVRFLSNPSSGRMGDAVARVARRRGARVTLVSGPTALAAPPGIDAVAVTSAAEMAEAVNGLFDSVDVVVMSAAVADFRPAQVAPGKVAKEDAASEVSLERTDDILAGLGARKGGQLLVGFAMETEELEARAAAKLTRKNLDLIVANDLTRPGAGFGHDTNEVIILAPDQGPERLSLRSKEQVADRILDRVAAQLEERG
jgi:phosphopantothenoylcysteine decarboxylase/phosphopantothenate--cysteine ligase